MNLTIAKTYLEITNVDSLGNRTLADMITNSNIKRVQCDGKTLFLNTKDYQGRSYDMQIAHADVAKYTYLGTETPIPSMWTIYDNLQTQLVTQAAHP